jgi:tetratricopeptide (TPR) repeat protein
MCTSAVHQRDLRVARTLLHLGQLYAQTGRREQGDRLIAEYNRNQTVAENMSRLTLRIASKPEDVNAYQELGRAYLKKGSFARAIVEFKRVLEMQPAHAEARALLIRALREAGRDEADEAQALPEKEQQQTHAGP